MNKNFLFRLKRKDENGSEFWICTHKVCNASIVTHQNLIIRTSSIKPDGHREFDTSEKDDADFEPIL